MGILALTPNLNLTQKRPTKSGVEPRMDTDEHGFNPATKEHKESKIFDANYTNSREANLSRRSQTKAETESPVGGER